MRSKNRVLLSEKLLSHSLTLDQLDLGALPPWLKLAYRSFTGKGSFSLELSMVAELSSQQSLHASSSFNLW